MRITHKSLTVAALPLVLGLAGCGVATQGTQKIVAQCVADAGITGTYATETGISGAFSFARIKVGRNVSSSQAADANTCIARKTGTAARFGKDGAFSGRLPLPTFYALQPGDDALWASMTAEQQQRAMRFLESGSTIKSSLLPD